MDVRKRLVKRFRRIANEHDTTYAEVLKIFKIQFKFTKDTIEALSQEDIENMTEKQLEDYTFNYLYLGKVYIDKKSRENGRKKNTKS